MRDIREGFYAVSLAQPGLEYRYDESTKRSACELQTTTTTRTECTLLPVNIHMTQKDLNSRQRHEVYFKFIYIFIDWYVPVCIFDKYQKLTQIINMMLFVCLQHPPFSYFFQFFTISIYLTMSGLQIQQEINGDRRHCWPLRASPCQVLPLTSWPILVISQYQWH